MLRHKQDLKGREARGGVGSPLANVIVVGGDDVLKVHAGFRGMP